MTFQYEWSCEKVENKDGELIFGRGGECLAIEDRNVSQNGRQQRSLIDAFPGRFKNAELIIPEGSLSAGKYVYVYHFLLGSDLEGSVEQSFTRDSYCTLPLKVST